MADSAPANLENAMAELNQTKAENAELRQKQKVLEAQLKSVINTFVFPFMGLSRELRDMVYKLLFTASDPILIQAAEICYKYPHQRRFPVALLRTCRQIYEEALPTLYGGTQVFQFCGDQCLSDFLGGIGKTGRETIRSLDLTFHDGPYVGIHALLRDCKALRSVKIRMRIRVRQPRQHTHDWMLLRGLEDLGRLRGLEKVEFGRYIKLSIIVSDHERDFVLPEFSHAGVDCDCDYEHDSAEFAYGEDSQWYTSDGEEGKELRERLTRPRRT